MSTFAEIIRFFVRRRKYWLWPMVAVVLLIGGLAVVTQGSAVAPFIYTLF